MEIKYEPVFGPQELFDGMMGACEFASEEYGYKFANGALYYCERYNEKAGWSLSCKSHLTFRPSAMRRIIRTPTWTVEDQKEGKLPEVGCIVFDKINETEVTIKVINKRQACLESNDGFIYLLPPSEIKPIESPEEKAARLKYEWAKNANELLFKRCSSTTLTEYLRVIHDAMLSGELSVPGKGE